jgi:hypothetical protein
MKRALDEIISRVGKAEFADACLLARQTAPGAGKSDKPYQAMPDFVYGLDNWIEELTPEPIDRIALLFAVYERMPCYALVAFAPSWLAADSPDALALWQRKYREFLAAEDDALADPIAYELWCGRFEGADKEVESWWRALTEGDCSSRLVERLLEHSGPVPYPLKAELYERILPDERYHPHVFRSLLGSCHDYFGQIDREKARQVFRRLRLPPDTEGLSAWPL